MTESLEKIMEWFSGFPEWLLCPLLVVLALVQYVFPPVPSDTLLVALGALVSNGVFNRFYGFLSYSAGAVAGALLLFELVYFLGDKVRKIKLIAKLIDDERLERSRRDIEKYGGASYFILRFVPSMQCITIIVMGLVKMNKPKARFFIGFVTFFACTMFYLLGLLLGSNIPALAGILDSMSTVGWILLGALAIAIVIIVIIIKTKKKK